MNPSAWSGKVQHGCPFPPYGFVPAAWRSNREINGYRMPLGQDKCNNYFVRNFIFYLPPATSKFLV